MRARARADLITEQFRARPFRVDKNSKKGEDRERVPSPQLKKTTKKEEEEKNKMKDF